MDDPSALIGLNLKELRYKRSLSLDDISSATGISKAMLSQIERGKSNPTVSTLWKIATGLKVPFSAFMEKREADYEVISCANLEPLLECEGKMKIYPFFPFDAGKNFEILSIELACGCSHQSPPHATGVEEYIFVFSGKLEMTLGTSNILLKQGEALKFNANLPHTYSNNEFETCTFQNLIVYNR